MQFLYIFLLNLGVSFIVAVWIIFDAKSRAMKSYTLQGLAVFIFGVIGLWLPYLLYYFIFRPPGRLVRCKEDKHMMLEWLEACPHCDPRLTWTEKKKAAKPELWDAFDHVAILMKKIPKSTEEIKKAETNAWFTRLAHAQDSFTRYFKYGMATVFLLCVLLVIIIFKPGNLAFAEALPLYIMVILSGFIAMGIFQLLYLVQGEIIRVKIVISALIDERAESIKMAEKRGLISYAAWTLQISMAIMIALNIYAISLRQAGIIEFVAYYGTTAFLRLFMRVLFIGLVFGCYLGAAIAFKNQVELRQMTELYDFLKKIVPPGLLPKVEAGLEEPKKNVKKIVTSDIIEEPEIKKTVKKKTLRKTRKTSKPGRPKKA